MDLSGFPINQLAGLVAGQARQTDKFPIDFAHAWGYQVRLVNTPLYAAKLLVFTNSTPGSLHHHKNEKAESFICLSGRVWVDLPDADIEGRLLKPGDVVDIPYGMRHRTKAIEYPAVILEVSTHDSDDFTYRILEADS